MDRTEYLTLCQKCAMITDEGVFHIKQNVPDKYRVVYDDIEYYPLSYSLSFDNNGQARHIAVLHDLKANSVFRVALDAVKKKTE